MRYLVVIAVLIVGLIGINSFRQRQARVAEEKRVTAVQDSVRSDSARQAQTAEPIDYRAESRQRTADAVAAQAAARRAAAPVASTTRNRTVVERAPGATNRAP
jgi:cytoskeletal protein RodZ